MTSLEIALNWIIETEGGYVNHPSDPGGETKYGISKRQYPYLDIESLSEKAARDIYRRDYWLKNQCDKLPAPLALFTFDCFVNHKPKTAAMLLQMAIGARADGIIGPMTLERASNSDQHTAVRFMALERLDYYDKIAQSNSKLSAFLQGWRGRVLDLYELILQHYFIESVSRETKTEA